jgi:methionine synthase II (cobalamin-independent)
LPRAVSGIVDRQIELGVDSVNDGECAKAGIAERIVNYARLVGRENVQTGTDCGGCGRS